jgi:hypothetical protein
MSDRLAITESQPWEKAMSYVTDAELAEIVPDLRALAEVETSSEVRDALIRLADRYAAMAKNPALDTITYEFAA